jgi:VIT1/CCC1 family predicted Fe2+/Mn2+ transporter
VTAGLAEIAAGSIAMGLGGYLAGKGDVEHYDSEEKREYYEVANMEDKEIEETSEIFKNYGLTPEQVAPIIDSFKKNPKDWVDFMMRFELGLEGVDPKRAFQSARNIALSYIVGGLVPLAPYMLLSDGHTALIFSVIATLIALFIFGFVKGYFTGTNKVRSGLYTMVVGGIAAAAAFTIARLV